MTVEVLFRYFSTLADRAPLPLLLYNAPGFNGLTLEPALVERLAVHPNIVGMKDSALSISGSDRYSPRPQWAGQPRSC